MQIKSEGLKVCCRGLNDIWVHGADGSVYMCGWTGYCIGNLTEQTIEKIWHGELARQFRESMLDGSYRYCDDSKCPYRANGELGKNMVDYAIPEYPEFCSLSYQKQCNYTCKFCRTTHYISCEAEREKYKIIEHEIRKIVPHLKVFSSNGTGELFCSNSILNLIKEAEFNESVKFELESNGSLFNRENWERICKVGEHDLSVAITIHSFDEATYQYLSGTSIPVKQVIENLHFISRLRRQGKINKFEIATVVCERNFREMPAFVKKCLDNFDMDTIRLRFFEPYGVMDLNTEWFYDIRNKFHPYHEEFVRVMCDPILKNEKVWKWQGDTESMQRENPYALEHKNAMSISRIILWKDTESKLESYLEHIGNPKIALYGANEIGRAFRKILKNLGVHIGIIFDTYLDERSEEDLEISRPDEGRLEQYGLIIITSEVCMPYIREELKRRKYQGISMTIPELLNELERQ